jgi:flagellar biosynthesis/type III secretory pathway protein FliH
LNGEAPHAHGNGKPAMEAVSNSVTVFEALLEEEVAVADPQAKVQIEAQVERDLAEARMQAERCGYADGQEKADAAARKAVSEQVERMTSIVASLRHARRGVLDGAEDAMIEMVYTAVCRIVGETATTRVAIAATIKQALVSFQQNDEVVVRLNPQDLALIRAADTEPHLDAIDARWQLRADASIDIGGCIVEGANGTLDARLDLQLANVRDALLAVRASREYVEEAI